MPLSADATANAPTLDLNQLRSVVAVSNTRHYGRAAGQLGVSKQVLSRRILTVEKALGTALFDRSHAGVSETLAGQAFCRYARRVVGDLNEASGALHSIDDAQRGRLRVGAGLSSNQLILPDVIRQLHDEGHAGNLSFYARDTNEMLEMLQRQELDCVLSTRADCMDGYPDVRGHRIFTSRDRVVHATSHPLSKRVEVTLANLVGYPWILYPSFPVYRQMVVTTFRRRGLPEPTEFLMADDPMVTKSLLSLAPYVAVWPGAALIREVREGSLFARDIPDLRTGRDVYLFINITCQQSHELQNFMNKVANVSILAQITLKKYGLN
ncbi:LysR family transcriptional regulator [Polymorphobacter sp.]|uniref:LysR family transcriptional regulator n=1 Tax=Polymorphobacter sp. TaxID=1909290 RepID=UPI003F700E24